MKNVAVIGYGVVGSGTVELFERNRESINRKVGRDCDIKYIVDLRDFPGDPFEDRMVKDFNVVLEDSEIQVFRPKFLCHNYLPNDLQVP